MGRFVGAIGAVSFCLCGVVRGIKDGHVFNGWVRGQDGRTGNYSDGETDGKSGRKPTGREIERGKRDK